MSSLSIEASSTDANRKIFFGGASMISSSKANSNEGLAISKKKSGRKGVPDSFLARLKEGRNTFPALF